MNADRLRIATYNVHKCRGLDRRVLPARIAAVIAELNADVIAIQEVLLDQMEALAASGDYDSHFGETRQHAGQPYGNAILSRRPVLFARSYDLSWRTRERRGCLRADIATAGARLHLFNVHLGTSFFERPHQARVLLGPTVLGDPALVAPSIVVGDFNEWTRGMASRMMSENFASVDLRLHTTRRRTYPGLFPVLHLDHFYYDKRLTLESFAIYRTRTSLLASDHLPLVAEFLVPTGATT